MFCLIKTFNLVVGSGAGFVGPRACSMLSTGDKHPVG